MKSEDKGSPPGRLFGCLALSLLVHHDDVSGLGDPLVRCHRGHLTHRKPSSGAPRAGRAGSGSPRRLPSGSSALMDVPAPAPPTMVAGSHVWSSEMW